MNALAADLMQEHPESRDLIHVLGELLGKAGSGDAIQALIDQIINTLSTKPTDWQRTTEVLCNKLAVFLPARVDDEKKAFGKVPELCALMSGAFTSQKGDAQLLASMALVSRRLADRFEDDATTPYGLKAIEAKLMPTIAATIVSNEKAKQNRNFLINSYRVMTVAVKHPKINSNAVIASKSTGLVPESYVLMKALSNDPDVLSHILEYLAALSGSPQGIEAVVAGYKTTGDRVCLEVRETKLRAFGLLVFSRLRKNWPMRSWQ